MASSQPQMQSDEVIIQDSNRGFGFLMTEASRLLRRLIDRRLMPLGLTRAQWAVLAALSARDGQTQSQLAESLEIEKSTAGRLIDHLESGGWLQRCPIPGDRRFWSVHLSAKAHPLIAEVQQIILDTRAVMLGGLSEPQQLQLSAAIRTVKANLSRALRVDTVAQPATLDEGGVA